MSFITLVGDKVAKVGSVLKKTYGPLAALEMPTKVQGTHRYPLDVGNSDLYPHTVEFQAWKPVPRSIKEVGSANINAATPSVQRERELEVGPPRPAPRVDENQTKNSRLFDFSRNAERSDLFALYIPAMLNERNINQYTTNSMTQALGLAGFVTESGAAVTEEFLNGANVDSLSPMLTELASRLAQGSGLIGDAGVLKDAGLQALGYATNPQLEVLYEKTELRNFSFEFKMTPRNAKEAEGIREIVKKLKYHASPEYIANQGRFVIPPSYFDITFKFKGKENLNIPMRISTCALTSIDVDYGGGLEQFASHADGHPITITLLIQFTEMEMMHKTLREEGY